MRSKIGAVLIALVALFFIVSPVAAGGWAVVTLDALPDKIEAGKPIQIGFMVRQHGVTPNDNVNTTLIATNPTTGEKIQVSGKKSGRVGHFTAEVTFPNAGSWTWEITPTPFEGTKLGTINVATASAPVATTTEASTMPVLRWLGVGVLVVAIGLMAAGVIRTRRNVRVSRV